MAQLERRITEQTQKIEYLEQELEVRTEKLACKKEKIRGLRGDREELETELARARAELIESEEKGIKLAGLLRGEVQSRAVVGDPSPTFKSFYEEKEAGPLNRSLDDSVHAPRNRYKSYGKEKGLENVRERLGAFRDKKLALEDKLRRVELQLNNKL